MLLHYLATNVLDPTQNILSLFTGPIIYSVFLFFFPAFLLGMDSPYIIKLISELTDPETSGKYVGTTFFWSTIGSICGSLSAGFWLIPNYGVQDTILYTGFMLVAIGLCTPLLLRNQYKISKEELHAYIFFVTITIIGSFLLLYFNSINAKESEGTLFSYSGFYTEIRVEEVKSPTLTIRQLRRDTNQSSAVFLENYEHVYAYTEYADLYTSLDQETKKVLVLGGGAYTVPRRYVAKDKTIEVDVVEIEPSLFPLAQKYFDLTDTSRINNYVSDARTFVESGTSTYDFIFVDVFGSALDIPFHLSTDEFFKSLAKILADDGVIVINSIGAIHSGENNFPAGLYKTLRNNFVQTSVYQTKIHRLDAIQNIMFVAHNNGDVEAINSFIIDTKTTGTSTLKSLQIDTSPLVNSPTEALTDDHAPVEYMLAEQMRLFGKNR